MKKNNIINVLDLIIFLGIVSLCVVAPLKFSLPFIEGMTRIYPESLVEWLMFPWPFELGVWLVFFLFTVWVIRVLVAGQVTIYKNFLDKYHLFLFVIICVATFFSINTYRSLSFLLEFTAILMFFYVVLYNLEELNIWWIILAGIIISSILICLYGLYQYGYGLEETRQWVFKNRLAGKRFSDEFLLRLSGNRVFSTFVYPNSLAGYVVLVIPVSLSFFFIRPKQLCYRLFFYITILSAFAMICFLMSVQKTDYAVIGVLLLIVFPLLQFLTLSVTLSKGGILTLFLLISCFVYFYFKKGKYKKYKQLIFVGYVVLVICFSLFMLKGKFGGQVSSRIKAPTVKVRLEYWQAALKMMGEQPLFGIGPNAFGVLYSKYKVAGAEDTQMAHNNYLQLGVEAGWLAFVIFCLMWGESVVRVLRYFSATIFTLFKEKTELLRNKKIWCVSTGFAILAFAIHSMVDFDLYIPSVALYAWLFLSVFVCYSGLSEKQTISFNEQRVLRVAGIFFVMMVFVVGSFWLKRLIVADYLFEVGKEQWKKKDITAVKTIKKAASLNPAASPYYFYLTRIYASQKEYALAIGFCEKAIKESQYTPYYHHFFGKLLYLEDREKGVLTYDRRIHQELQKAIVYSPNNTRYRLALAKYFEELGFLKDAVLEYKKALTLKPNDAIIQKKIAELEKKK